MNIKRTIMAWGAIASLLSLGACSDDWGKSDPEAGNQVYPSRQVVSTYTFEYEEGSEYSDITQLIGTEGENYAIFNATDRKTNTLWLKNGVATLANPLNDVKVQNGAAVTFWVKCDTTATNESINLLAFGDLSTGTALSISDDGVIRYYYDPTNWSSSQIWEKDSLCDGNWHFIALQMRNDGYDAYLDGSLLATVSNSDDAVYAEMVQFMQSAPYIYLVRGDQAAIYDDITFIRNQMEQKDWNKKFTGGSSSGETTEREKEYIQVGETDFSNGWWTAFSDCWNIKDGETLHIGFYNYGSGANVWENWLLVCTDGGYSASVPDKGGTGNEHFVLRSDFFGWGDANYNGANISHDFDFSTFNEDMSGAWVEIDVNKNGGVITMTAVITTTAGKEYHYTYKQEGATEEETGIFLTAEKAYLLIDPEKVYIGTSYESGSYVVGAADFTTGWWSAFSEAYTFDGDVAEELPFVAHFYNNTSGESPNVWNNWLVIFTGGGYCSNMPGVTGDGAEYAVFRADAGWWSLIGAAGSVDFTYDAETWVSDMSGAECWVAISRAGTATKLRFKMIKSDGVTWFNDGTFNVTLPEGSLSAIFSVELASLDFIDVGYYPYFDKIHP